MFFDTTPDTVAYMVAGYAVFFSITFIYVASLFLRWKKLREELKMMEEIEKK